jgi:hypothetical protein
MYRSKCIYYSCCTKSININKCILHSATLSCMSCIVSYPIHPQASPPAHHSWPRRAPTPCLKMHNMYSDFRPLYRCCRKPNTVKVTSSPNSCYHMIYNLPHTHRRTVIDEVWSHLCKKKTSVGCSQACFVNQIYCPLSYSIPK